MPARVAVVGAGISGLAAAVELRARGIDVIVFEASDRAGGPIHTVRSDDYIIDAGPDSFLSTKPGGISFAERLGIADQLINTSPDGGGTYIVHDGAMQPLPEGITMLVPTQFRQILESPLLDFSGKARLLGDYLIPARSGDDDESVAAFMRRRVGRQAFEHLAEPLLSGIFAGDATRLSIEATFPRLREAERRHGGLIRAALAARKAAATAQSPPRKYTPFVSLRGGLGAVVDAAIDRISADSIRYNTPVTAITSHGTGYRLDTASGAEFSADAVILATPAGPTANLLRELAPRAAQALESIPYVSSATVSMAFDEADVRVAGGGRGFVVPRVEGFDLTAVTWSSRKFAGRAPEGSVLLRGFVGRAGNEEPAFLPDNEVIETVRRDLASITGIAAEPRSARVFRWHNAMPQFHVGHRELVQEIQAEIGAVPDLAVVGAAYRGVGIPDCVTFATGTATSLAESLNHGSTSATA